MLWVWISLWVVGVSLIVFSFAAGVSFRRWTLAVVMFIVGLACVGGAVAAGHGRMNAVHGIRVDETGL
ncbi:MAG TPA: hypothetical protein VFS44_11150 [Gemmatimonadaceae bacterium]|nr:hypothetical protein [Gemmatimonadaceae bacterium]